MRIVEFKTNREFRFLWLKYVAGFDLNVHCAKCLIGEYSSIFKYGAREYPEIRNVELDEHEARYMYLCGVTPKWKDNLHVAFCESKGETMVYDDGITRFVVQDARRIDIVERDSYALEAHGNDKWYNTCRNWRFAYQCVHND